MGCKYRKDCYMKDLDCYFMQRYPCIHLDTILHIKHDKEMEQQRKQQIEDLDYKLQMEIGCI
jgi:hypothetical protein